MTLVIGVGLPTWGNTVSCVATSTDIHYVNVASYAELATVNVKDMICQDSLSFAGQYQQFFPNSDSGHYRYVSYDGIELSFFEEFWQIGTDGVEIMIAREGNENLESFLQNSEFPELSELRK